MCKNVTTKQNGVKQKHFQYFQVEDPVQHAFFKDVLNYLSLQFFLLELDVLYKNSRIFVICNHHLIYIN